VELLLIARRDEGEERHASALGGWPGYQLIVGFEPQSAEGLKAKAHGIDSQLMAIGTAGGCVAPNVAPSDGAGK